MIRLAAGIRGAIEAAARAAWPREACGLLVGEDDNGTLRVARLVPADNVASDPLRGFEIDPATRFRLHRELAGGGERLVGHWHSHPTGVAEPSATDRAMQYEPELCWLICGVSETEITGLAAFQPDGAGGFAPRALVDETDAAN